jgi:rhodanese-related sulfurtransferase
VVEGAGWPGGSTWSRQPTIAEGAIGRAPNILGRVELPLEVGPREAHSALSGSQALLIDVREPWEWQELRIPGAKLVPLADLPSRLDELPEDADIYVHCKMGGRSLRAVEYLRSAGRPRSVNVRGGIDAWQGAGLPTEG